MSFLPSAGVAGIAEDSTGPIQRTEKYKAVGDPDLGARARGVLGYQLRGQCPQAILQTPLLHKSQRVRGLKLRIEGEHAAQAPAHHSLFDWTNSAPTWSHTERSGLVTSNAVWP